MDRWIKYGSLKKTDVVSSNAEIAESTDTGILEHAMPSTSSSVQLQPHLPTLPSSNFGQVVSTKRRKYDTSYLSFGFTSTGDEEAPDAVCLLCNKILANSSLAPAKLLRHLEKNHPTDKGKDISYFKRKLESHNNCKSFMVKKFKTDNQKITEASYKVSYRIALAGEAHVIGESLIKPCVQDIVSCVLGEGYSKEVESVSLSNNTVKRRINDIADDIEIELISRLQACDVYVLQLDESTDVAGLAILLVFVRYDFNKNIEEDLLLCESVKINTTGENIFNCIDNFMKTHEINWGKCIEVCSDGAKAMTGKVSGAVARIKNVAKNCNSTHCILHRYALVTKRISVTFKSVLDEAVKIINFIKSRPLQSRIFKAMCEDMGSLHTTLLLHTEVRWLSRGKILVRIFELRKELLAFFIGHKFELSDRLNNMTWLSTLAYLADIFGKLNDLCLALQGKQVNILQTKDKLVAFSRKIEYWISAVEQNNFECFQTLCDFLAESEVDLDMEIRDGIKTHLYSLQQSLSDYFPNLENQDNYWVQNPFKINEKPKGFHSMDYENLIELSSDTQLEAKFRTVSLTIFWSDVFDEYPILSKQAIRILLPFATTYLCEAGFSKYVATKTKYRNKLDAAPDMRVQLSNITPNFKRIMESKKQMHSSH